MTWKEILKAKGLTDAQIAEIEKTAGAAVSEFDVLIQTAETKNAEATRLHTEATEKTKKLNEWWNDDATKQINEAFSKASTAEAQAAFYRTQVEEAKKAGFIGADAPGYKPPAADPANPNPGGHFVPGGNPTPGSPRFMTSQEVANAVSNTFFISNEHQRLFGEPLPGEALSQLMQEASEQKTTAMKLWESKYKVPEKRAEITANAQKAHDDKIAKETEERVRREYAEKYGNPETRPMVPSRFPKYAQDGAQGGKPDKLAWTRPNAKENFRQKIHEQVAKETTVH